jgi:transposase-like protein
MPGPHLRKPRPDPRRGSRGYAPDRSVWTEWTQRWRCRRCTKTVTVAVPDAPPRPNPEPLHQDRYQLAQGELRCLNCGEVVTVRSNEAIVSETERISRYLEPRRGAGCPGKPGEPCENRFRPVDLDADGKFYQDFGSTRAGSKRYRCRSCGTVFSVARSTTGHRRPEVNILLFKLLLARVSLSKIASILEISRPAVYEKIEFLQAQCLAFQGDRERAIADKRFPELLLATDRQSYLCNWNSAADARNLQITSVATADTKSGYVLAANVAYDPIPDRNAVEAEAITVGDYDQPGEPYRKYARVWLEGDFAVRSERAENVRDARREKRQQANGTAWDIADEEDEDFYWDRKLPDFGMLVHADYTLHAHFRVLQQLVKGAERLCIYTEKEPGFRAAMMAAFQEEILADRLEAFQVMITKELTVKRRRALVSQSQAAFRAWLKARRAQKKIAGESWEECRTLKLLEEIDSPDPIEDKRSRRTEPWVWHPFPNLAEPEKRVLHLTARPPLASANGGGATELRVRAPIDRQRLAYLYDKASLHAVDRYFMQVRRELAALERGIAVASNKRRVWYGYTPYNPAMIPKLIDVHRTYYNWIQVGEDGETRAERFGLARGKIRHQDIVYYR